MRQFPGNVAGPHMLRKFPAQTQFVKPPMMNQDFMGSEMDMMNPNMGNPEIDPNFKRDYYGERLYSKISSKSAYAHMNEMFSRIVGIFLDLEEPVIERLIKDDAYFDFQVKETLRLLAEKGSH